MTALYVRVVIEEGAGGACDKGGRKYYNRLHDGRNLPNALQTAGMITRQSGINFLAAASIHLASWLPRLFADCVQDMPRAATGSRRGMHPLLCAAFISQSPIVFKPLLLVSYITVVKDHAL